VSNARRIVLSTARLALSEFHLDDAAGLVALNAAADVLGFTGDPPFADVADAARFIAAYPAYRRDGFGRYTMRRAGDDAYVGWCGLRRGADGGVDVGFRVVPAMRGHGYATEAARACVVYGFRTLGLTRIIGRAAADNAASLRVLARCGMRRGGPSRIEGVDGPAWLYEIWAEANQDAAESYSRSGSRNGSR
jgi:RimJ/RimL family protein N-acetyltransferase